ncbi:MAG TPA: LPP20 family lipoprotein [Vulgatibacter sp.]|nr:LPP20 family lipoprotein [Vulgatibacter sp.]
MSLVVAMVWASGCASTPKTPADAVEGELTDAPEWVRKGCDAWWGEKMERRICGVGAAGSTRNAALARTGAIARGRTEIARSLGVRVEALIKDYQATTTGGEAFGVGAADDQHLIDVSKQITDLSLAGTTLVDSWISSSGTFYALVALDVEGFKDAVSKMQNLSEGVRAAVIERADRAFEDLDREIDRRRAP